MITCLTCQAQNLQGLTQCRQCGAPLATAPDKTAPPTTDASGGPLILDPDLPLPNNKIQRPLSDELLPFELDDAANDPLGDVFTSAAPLDISETSEDAPPIAPAPASRHTAAARRNQKTRTWKPRKLAKNSDDTLSTDPTIASLQQRLAQIPSNGAPGHDDNAPPRSSKSNRHHAEVMDTVYDSPSSPNVRRQTPRALPVFTPGQRRNARELTQPITATMPQPFMDIPTNPGPTPLATFNPPPSPPPGSASRPAKPPPIPTEAKAAPTDRSVPRHRQPSGETLISTPLGNAVTESPQTPTLPTDMSGLRLAFLTTSGQIFQLVPLKVGRSLIGREDGDILLTGDPAVSPWHAQLTVSKNGVFIKDMNTLNGVFLRQMGHHTLQDKDNFILGHHRFIFRDRWDPPPEAAQELIPIGAPGYEAPERLLLLREGGQVVGVYLLDKALTIGRDTGDLSFPADPLMSPEHALICRGDDRWTLSDLSRQGIYVQIRDEVELSSGQSFQIGRTRFRLVR